MLPNLTGAARRRALDCYFDAVFALGAVSLDVDFVRRAARPTIPSERPPGRSVLASSRARLCRGCSPQTCATTCLARPRRRSVLRRHGDPRRLVGAVMVHGDYFPGNVMRRRGRDGHRSSRLRQPDDGRRPCAGCRWSAGLSVDHPHGIARRRPQPRPPTGEPRGAKIACVGTRPMSASTPSGTCTRATAIRSCTAGACRSLRGPTSEVGAKSES